MSAAKYVAAMAMRRRSAAVTVPVVRVTPAPAAYSCTQSEATSSLSVMIADTLSVRSATTVDPTVASHCACVMSADIEDQPVRRKIFFGLPAAAVYRARVPHTYLSCVNARGSAGLNCDTISTGSRSW